MTSTRLALRLSAHLIAPALPPLRRLANPFNSVLSSRRTRGYGVSALPAVSSAFACPPAGGASSKGIRLLGLASWRTCGSAYSLLAPWGVL
ncbi:hypothetical protein FB451DRAFT_1417983 [Mycena latifolia]|nr:hypothetical protein FB451DRAFT_1417983 [Mycena latifolia]